MVVIDWRYCQDTAWRKKKPVTFRQRAEDLANTLNSDLWPLDLAVLHCIGYVHQSITATGCVFRPPPGASPNDRPVNLQDVFAKVKSVSGIPDS